MARTIHPAELLTLLLALSIPALAMASDIPAAAPASNDPEQLYEQGTVERQRGHTRESKELFLQFLKIAPDNGGAYEGLALACLALRQFDEARTYLEQWNSKSPNNPYILELLARAYLGERRFEDAIRVYSQLVQINPRNKTAQTRLDDLMRQYHPGVFPQATIYKAIAPEELDTPAPQRIVYEGHSGGVNARIRLRPRLNLTAGVEARQEAQRNETGGFTYYDILDQIDTLGLEAQPTDDLRLEASYGESFLSDNEGSGVGHTQFSQARLAGHWHRGETDTHLILTRSPYFLRGAGGSRFFALLREVAAQAAAETFFHGWEIQGRAGLEDFSEGTTYVGLSLIGTREWSHSLFQPRLARFQREFYGATPDGHIGYVNAEQIGARYRWLVEDRASFDAFYAYDAYSDSNHVHEINAALTGWLPWNKDFSAFYRYSLQDYLRVSPNYISSDPRAHELGGQWYHGYGRGIWTTVGASHGFLNDSSRGDYEANTLFGKFEYFIHPQAAFELDARGSRSTVHDDSFTLHVQGRYTF